jgi:hypothetical protein
MPSFFSCRFYCDFVFIFYKITGLLNSMKIGIGGICLFAGGMRFGV